MTAKEMTQRPIDEAVARLDALARAILPIGTVVSVVNLGHPPPALRPAEQAAVAKAVPKRQREFAHGRAAARQALAQLGQPLVALPQHPDRSPIWPSDVVGSISHCKHIAVAAASMGPPLGLRALGVDIEEASPLDENLLHMICRPAEIAWLNQFPTPDRLIMAKMIFSAKEAAYKCQYPLSGKMFDFDGFQVTVDPANGAFLAEFQHSNPVFAKGTVMKGRYGIIDGFVLCSVSIPAPDFAPSASRDSGGRVS